MILAALRRKPQHPGRGRRSPLRLETLREVCAGLPGDLEGTRDRAVLTLGWAAALRRSEVAALEVEDIEEAPGGLIVHIRRSKTDQEGKGDTVGAPFASQPDDPACPVVAWADWIAATGIDSGPLFRGVVGHELRGRMSGWMVWAVVKRHLGHLEGDWGGHSLRAGLATESALAGAPVLTIQRQTRHRNLNQLLAYVRVEGDLFTSNAATLAGL